MNEAKTNSSFKKARNILLFIFSLSVVFGTGYFMGYQGFLFSFDKFPVVTVNRSYLPEKELNFSLFPAGLPRRDGEADRRAQALHFHGEGLADLVVVTPLEPE